MEFYMNYYDNYNKIIVFDFRMFEGGVGDYIKYFIYLLELCIRNNIRLHYLINNILIEKYIRLKYEKMYISIDKITNSINLDKLNLDELNYNTYYLVRPHLLYHIFTYDNYIIPNEIFYFHNDIILNTHKLLNINEYISIHVRLGDKFLEINNEYIQCKNDVREFDENKLFDFIQNNYNNNIILFTDNKEYKLKLKNKYDKIIILDTNIGHTALINTTEEQVLDTITEFYIMSNSKYIYISTHTGFSIMAAKFNNISHSYVF